MSELGTHLERLARGMKAQPLLVRADDTTMQALMLMQSPADAGALLLFASDPDRDMACVKISAAGVLELRNVLDTWLERHQ